MRSHKSLLVNELAHLHASAIAFNRNLSSLFLILSQSGILPQLAAGHVLILLHMLCLGEVIIHCLHSSDDILEQAIELTSEKGLNLGTVLAFLPQAFSPKWELCFKFNLFTKYSLSYWRGVSALQQYLKIPLLCKTLRSKYSYLFCGMRNSCVRAEIIPHITFLIFHFPAAALIKQIPSVRVCFSSQLLIWGGDLPSLRAWDLPIGKQ